MTATLQTTNIQNATSSTTNLALDTSGNVTVGSSLTAANNITATSGTVVMASSFLRNRIINGAMQIAQRGTSATVTAGTAVPTASAGFPCVDRWFVYSTGANVTAAQVAGSGNNKNLLQITGAASVTAVGVGQRIEQLNSYDLAGQTCTLSVYMANSVLTTVTWTASYANTADTFGTIGTPSKTQIATGTFTVSSSLTQYTTNISIPSAATTGIEILFTVGAQTSGTWTIGLAQLEPGSVATPFERRQYGQELALCQRYYEKTYDITTAPGTVTNNGILSMMSFASKTIRTVWKFAVSKRTAPSITFYNPNNGSTTNPFRDFDSSTNYNGGTDAIGTDNVTASWYYAAGGGNTNGEWGGVHITASAEL